MSFETYRESLSEADNLLLQEFFADFEEHCSLSKLDRRDMRSDFEQAIFCHMDMGFTLERSLELLDVRNLGGFYARPPLVWFSLDDAAKIYPLSMAHGTMSVFRLSVSLRQSVRPALLQMALTFTIKRFPSFATTLKKGVFWHYLDSTKRRFAVEPERDIPCQPLKVSSSGSIAFRVVYFENRISVEFFHMLTDGSGGMTFLKALTAEYLRLCGVAMEGDSDIWDRNATPSAQEVENAFANIPPSGSGGGGLLDKGSTQMSGRFSRNNPCRILHFKMPVTELKAAAQRFDATVTVYLLGQMFLAARAASDELTGEFSIQVPVNMRKYYPSPTVRNFSMYCAIRERVENIGDFSELICLIRRQLEAGTSREAVSVMASGAARLVKSLRFIPLIIKQPVARLIFSFLNDNAYTNIFSNLGVVVLPPAMAAEVESMDFVLGTASKKRAACAAVSTGGIVNFCITKNILDPSFEEKMYELLLADGIHVEVEGSELYEA